MHGTGRLGVSIGYRHDSLQGPASIFADKSEHRERGRSIRPDMVRHGYDRLYRIGRLVWNQECQRLSIDRAHKRNLDLRADLHGARRPRVAIGYRIGEFECARGDHRRQPEHR